MNRQANYTLLPYDTITRAVNGNVEAINIVVSHYSRYINSLARRIFYDGQGVSHTYVDEQLKHRIETKLICSLSNFNL